MLGQRSNRCARRARPRPGSPPKAPAASGGIDLRRAQPRRTGRLHESRFLKRRGRFFVSFPSFFPLHSLALDAPAPWASHRPLPDRFLGLIPPLQGFLSCRFSPFFCVPRFLLFCRPTCLRNRGVCRAMRVFFPIRIGQECRGRPAEIRVSGSIRGQPMRRGGGSRSFFPHFVEAMRRFRAPWAPPRNLADLLRLARRALGFAI